MKSILIDGASLSFMVRGLGQKRIEYEGLKRVLIDKVGDQIPLAHKPIITVRRIGSNPDPGSFQERFARYLGHIGYEVLRYESVPGRSVDDELLKERIRQFDEKITQIVIVTSDFDFNTALQEAWSQGVNIYWVASEYAVDSKSGHKMLSPIMAIAKNIHFVELKDYLPEITKSMELT